MIDRDVELRRHVERIVRPLAPAEFARLRMREELLGHLFRIYEEELAEQQGKDDAAAAAAAAVGDPAALRTELQATVRRIEQVMCAPLPRPTTRFGAAW